MAKTLVDQVLDQFPWLDSLADAIQPIVVDAFKKGGEPGQMLKDLLNGVPLGHPLHPAITDVPIGAWTMTQMFDVLAMLSDDEELDRASDILLIAGIVAALGAAVTGVVDWADIHNKPRKVATAHALLNSAGLALNLASLAARVGGGRGLGRALSAVGYGVSTSAAFLGGELTFTLGTNVNHNAFVTKPTKFRDAVEESELAGGKMVKATVDGTEVVLVKHDDGIHAFAGVCPHAGGPLEKGTLEGHVVTCPWHGSQFDVSDGRLVHGPATANLPCFETRSRNGKIQVRLEPQATSADAT